MAPRQATARPSAESLLQRCRPSALRSPPLARSSQRRQAARRSLRGNPPARPRQLHGRSPRSAWSNGEGPVSFVALTSVSRRIQPRTMRPSVQSRDVPARQPCLRERKLETVGRFTGPSPAIGWQRLLIFRGFWIDAANVSPPGGLPIIRGRGCQAPICRRDRDKRGQDGPAGSITSALRSLRGSLGQQGPGGVSRPRLRVQDAHEARLGIRDRATERYQLIFDHG